jgi:hypothetical protein
MDINGGSFLIRGMDINGGSFLIRGWPSLVGVSSQDMWSQMVGVSSQDMWSQMVGVSSQDMWSQMVGVALYKGDYCINQNLEAAAIVITWLLNLQLPVQSVPITTKVLSSNLVHDEVYSIQHYVIKFVSDL